MRPSSTARLLTFVLALLPCAAGAQSDEDSELPADSAGLLKEAEHQQTRFESYRESRLPPSYNTEVAMCDELVGRLCFRHETGYDPLPQEPLEIGMARRELLQTLGQIGQRIPGDNWVLGQRVFYMGESGQWGRAQQLAKRCNGAELWWCKALVATTEHAMGQFVEAQATFEEAMKLMPPEVLSFWLEPGYLLDGDGRELYEQTAEADWSALHARMWKFADPLYLVDGNDRLTADYARRTIALIREKAANPFGMEWEDDLTQLVLRYGQEVAWERMRPPPQMGLRATDDRYVVGRHESGGTDYVPPGRVIKEPSETKDGDWRLEHERPRSAYKAPYMANVQPFEAQTARFRRGDSLLVVAAFQPASVQPNRIARRGPQPGQSAESFGETDGGLFGTAAADPSPVTGDPTEGTLESGLFLVDQHDLTTRGTRGNSAFGVLTYEAPPGQYLLSIEAFNQSASFGWRNRVGVSQNALPLGLAAVSDILLLDPDGPLPETLDEAVPHAKKGVRIGPGEPIRLAWEVYGLGRGEVAEVTIGFDRGAPSILRIAGQFLGLLEPEGEPVLMSWEQAAPDVLGTVFRSVDLTLPDLDPGEYTIYVEVQLQGREAMVTSRRLYIEG